MLYQEYKPAAEVAQWVECYWKFLIPQDPENSPQPIPHVFPPEGSCSLLFVRTPTTAGIWFVGPATQMQPVWLYPNSIYLGIRLKPGYSARLHSVAPASIRNSALPCPDAPAWQQDWLARLTLDFDTPALLDDLLTQHTAAPLTDADPRVQQAVELIRARAGAISVKEVSAHCNLGMRHLQRLFRQHTGIHVKQLCQLRRLRQTIIELYVHHKPQAQTIYEAGFADEAHFHKSFRRVAGYNRAQFLAHIRSIQHLLV